ncbi:hypothetical protein [Spirosoma litoris]
MNTFAFVVKKYALLLIMAVTCLAGHAQSAATGSVSETPRLPLASDRAEIQQLVAYLRTLAASEKNPLLKRHFESVIQMSLDSTHGLRPDDKHVKAAVGTLTFFQGEGAKWETYLQGTRPSLWLSNRKPMEKIAITGCFCQMVLGLRKLVSLFM